MFALAEHPYYVRMSLVTEASENGYAIGRKLGKKGVAGLDRGDATRTALILLGGKLDDIATRRVIPSGRWELPFRSTRSWRAVKRGVLAASSGTGQTSRTLANPAAGTFWRGVRARVRLGRRFDGLYQAAQRSVIRARRGQLAELQATVGYQGRVRYLHEAGSSTFNHAIGEIIIRQHAFYEPGRLKSIFLHEVAHSEVPMWATEFMVDQRAASIAERIFGHSDDIILPFTD